MDRNAGLRLALALSLCLAASACAATIVPPPQVARPARAAVLDHGRHSSLLLERRDGAMVRYAYGQWEWYALGNTGPGRAFGALFLPSEATLGRRLMPGPLSSQTAREQVKEGFQAVFVFAVEAERAARLENRLEAMFDAGRDRLVFHPGFELEFVPVRQSYWLGDNSNVVMAEWLRELGCEVENPGFLSVWRLAEAAGEPRP